MRAQLRTLWESRSPRDRIVIIVFAAVVSALLYVWLVHSAYRARAQLGASLSVLRIQALRLERDAAELERVRNVQVPPATPSDLRTQVQAQIAAAGLTGSLVRLDATDANTVQVTFGSIAFADWIEWVTALQARRIRLDTGRIEALTTPGLVGVSATFTRTLR